MAAAAEEPALIRREEAVPAWAAAEWVEPNDAERVQYGVFFGDARKPAMVFTTKHEAEAEASRLNDLPPSKPTVIVVSGPPGSGKTTLAHALAQEIGCPAVCRDAIKEGMVHAVRAAGGDFEPGAGDPLSARAVYAFSDILRVLVTANASVVAEAAYKDPLWRLVLEPVADLAALRIVHCSTEPSVAWKRVHGARLGEATRAAHAVATYLADPEAWNHDFAAFPRLSLLAPAIEVDTTDGYAPSLGDVVRFVAERHVVDEPSGK